MNKKKSNKANKKRLLWRNLFIFLLLFGIFAISVSNVSIIGYAALYTLDFSEAVDLGNVDCIVVLGAGLKPDGSPSNILRERISCGAELYLAGASERILVSGDHSRENYDEANAMKDYMISRGIAANVVFTDHAGVDTYDTFYRAKEIFGAERIIIVTQDFHLPRAIFIARALGLDAYGVECDTGALGHNFRNELREFFARPKYIYDAIFKPDPKFLGEAIPIWGDASASDG